MIALGRLNPSLSSECEKSESLKRKSYLKYMLLFLFSLLQTYVNLNQYDHSLYANVQDLTAE